jgi:hypothetical protein
MFLYVLICIKNMPLSRGIQFHFLLDNPFHFGIIPSKILPTRISISPEGWPMARRKKDPISCRKRNGVLCNDIFLLCFWDFPSKYNSTNPNQQSRPENRSIFVGLFPPLPAHSQKSILGPSDSTCFRLPIRLTLYLLEGV